MKKEKSGASACEFCTNYIYEEEDDCYYCDVNLDEDEMYRFLSGNFRECPYYRSDVVYRIVRHQM